jgi:hypothetical protein
MGSHVTAEKGGQTGLEPCFKRFQEEERATSFEGSKDIKPEVEVGKQS